MSLHKTDFNLLKAFDALMQTRHVTRAAQLAGIGQPGMSAALSRLRETFQDDLLVRQGGCCPGCLSASVATHRGWSWKSCI